MANLTVNRYLSPRRAFCLCSSWSLHNQNHIPPQSFVYQRHRMSTAAEEEVIIERKGSKGIITLNRPQALNALNLSMIRKIYPQLRKWEMDNSMKMVILKGAGDKAFCAGGDVRAIAESGKDSTLGDEFFREEYRLNNLIGSLAIPYLALINGICMGGGVGLSVHGSFRVVTEKAVFAMPETAIGFFPDVGGSHFLPRLPGKLGLYLALTGQRLTGRDIYKAGIATHFVPSANIPALEEEILRLDNPENISLHRILSKFQEQWEADYKKEFTLKPLIGRMNAAFDSKSVEEIFDKLSKDPSEWAKRTLETLKKMSPTSLKVTFEQLRRGREHTLPECLKMEYNLSQRFMQKEDFYEGVSSILINKSGNPIWSPATLAELSDEDVQWYFSPSGKRELQL